MNERDEKEGLAEQRRKSAEQRAAEKRGEGFKLEIDDEIKKIPDYVSVKRVRKGRYRMSVFTKVMFAIIIVGLSIILSLTILFALQDIFGLGKTESNRIIEIKQSEGLSQIAETLKEAEIINSEFLFKAYYKLIDADVTFQYGTYELKTGMSYDSILSELEKYSAVREEVSIMFKEGITLYEMADLLEINGVCKAADFISTVNNTDFGYDFEKNIPDNPLRFHKMEGYLFPDTYNFFTNDNPTNVASKFLANTQRRVFVGIEEELKGSTLTQDEIFTIASIVQMEASQYESMRMVASVYLNRIKNSAEYPRLQADPTTKYSEQLRLQMSILDTNIINAYDTYEGLGLPPGAICNPGLDAIRAVLNPAETDYYYFCNNIETGEFFFATTLEEHNVNLRKANLR